MDIGLLGFVSNVEIVDLVGFIDVRVVRAFGGYLDKVIDLVYIF